MKNKFIGTYHCFSGLHLKIIRKMLSCESEKHGQFRIVCKARGLDHANELTKDLGHKVFHRMYTSETGNTQELEMFEKNPQITYIIGHMYRESYITDIQLNKITELIEENAEDIISAMFKEIQGYENIDIILKRIAERYGVEVDE